MWVKSFGRLRPNVAGMIALETGGFVLMLLASALVGALIVVVPAWRRLRADKQDLPVWRFLRQRGVVLERRAALDAELRCALCAGRRQCARRDAPLEDCPNAAHLPGKVLPVS